MNEETKKLIAESVSQREDEILRSADLRHRECFGDQPHVHLSDLRTLLQDKPMSSSENPQTP